MSKRLFSRALQIPLIIQMIGKMEELEQLEYLRRSYLTVGRLIRDQEYRLMREVDPMEVLVTATSMVYRGTYVIKEDKFGNIYALLAVQ